VGRIVVRVRAGESPTMHKRPRSGEASVRLDQIALGMPPKYAYYAVHVSVNNGSMSAAFT
jgi:hypothetical protein